MENVKLGGKIYRGVQAIKMDTEGGGTAFFLTEQKTDHIKVTIDRTGEIELQVETMEVT